MRLVERRFQGPYLCIEVRLSLTRSKTVTLGQELTGRTQRHGWALRLYLRRVLEVGQRSPAASPLRHLRPQQPPQPPLSTFALTWYWCCGGRSKGGMSVQRCGAFGPSGSGRRSGRMMPPILAGETFWPHMTLYPPASRASADAQRGAG